MMKRIILSILLLAMFFAAKANPVGVEQARKVGASWLSARGHSGAVKLDVAESPFAEVYVFNADGGGFVLVAADDCARPVLGYSLTGSFRIEDMPANVRSWLEDYGREIGKTKEKKQGSRNNANANEWRLLSAGAAPEQPLTTAVSPMLTTTWDQSPLYNDMCPYDSVYGQRVVTGCVATATAQIMKYWNHPATGYGSHSYVAQNDHINYGVLSANFGATNYEWNIMPNAVTYASSQAEHDAVALLMLHVGIAIEMQYNVSSQGGSGAYNHSDYYPSSMSALVEYFKYAPDIVVVAPGYYDHATYSAVLRAELDQQRPILYNGRDESGGHSFVCDGYDESGYFHFNWGWGGYCDGYYALGALNPAPGGAGGNATYTFNISNTAMLRIRPNTNFGDGGTVTVNIVGGNSACAVTGAGTYNFGDTVTLAATTPEGYRFAGWSDNSQNNPRTFIMNGGNYSFTARFETIGTDTMSYCGNMGHQSNWGEYQQDFDKYWGIKLPASSLTPGRSLKAVDFYVGSSYYGGYFDLTVYSGTTTPTDTVYTTSLYVDYSDREGWYSVFLPTPYNVEAGKSIWITFHNSDILFPATITASCGNPDGFLYGASFAPDPEWTRFSFMIRGRFVDPGVIADGDTISYCGDKRLYTSWSFGEWGIMLPSADLAGRNYLKAVKMYPTSDGTYILRVYKGGADAPATLVHTQPAHINASGWQEITLDHIVAINANDSLWITLSSPDAEWPAAACRYTGNPNSDWIYTDGAWHHIDYYAAESYSWLIKAVTSTTAPVLPPPTVTIRGSRYVGIGTQVMLIAAHTTGTMVTWTMQGTTPTTATGDTVWVSWNQPGWYQVTAAVSNSNGTDGDTLWVNVVDCSQAITDYPWILDFEEYDNMVCVDNIDADNDGYGWYWENRPYYGSRSFYSMSSVWTDSGSLALTADDWLILPKMTTRQGAGYGYSIRWYDYMGWSGDLQGDHYGVYIDTTAGTNTANYVLLQGYTIYNNWWEERWLDLSAYAGKTFRLAFRHNNNDHRNGLYIDYVTVSEDIPFFREGDTISYCGFRDHQNQLGYNGATHWGVKFEPQRLVGCDTVKSVLLYVTRGGSYTLKIWQGGDDAPATLLRTMDTTFSGQYGWQEFVLDTAVALDASQPLWITFVSTASGPATCTMFSGDDNSNWLSSDGVNWVHSTYYGSNYSLSWMIKAVTSANSDCSNLTLPYSANFTQCWTASGGATVVDANHASITSYGQKIVSPWLQSAPGKTYVAFTIVREDGVSWEQENNNEQVTITFENANGSVDQGNLWPGNSGYQLEFQSNGGPIRVTFEYTGNSPVSVCQIADVHIFNYQMDVTVIGPDVASVGDTLTFIRRATLQDGGQPDQTDWYAYDMDWYYYDLSYGQTNSTLSVVATTDSSVSLVFNRTGGFHIYATVMKNSVYQGHSAYASDSRNVTVAYIEDSIYYSSAVKDTVIGCHPQLHAGVLSQNARVIANYAFQNHATLSSISMPDSLTYIGHMAFAECNQLQAVTIPRGVQFIGDNAFWACHGLTTVNFNADSCVTVSPSTASDGSYWPAFMDCYNVRTINIGENVKRIPDRIFWGCYGLCGTLVIPDAVTYIGYDAFTGWNGNWNGGADTLAIVLGSSVAEIGDYAFGMPFGKMHSVVAKNTVPATIGPNTFYVHQSIATLTVPCGTIPAYMASPYWNDFVLVYDDCTGIEDVDDADMPRIYGVSNGIVVDGADGEQVRIYDMMGRHMASATAHRSPLTFNLPTGVYMVVVGERPACKVVVLK